MAHHEMLHLDTGSFADSVGAGVIREGVLGLVDQIDDFFSGVAIDLNWHSLP